MKLFSPVVSNNLLHAPVKFNSSRVTRCSHQKYLGVVLDLKLNFDTHIDQKIKKCDKMIGLIRQLSVNLPCDAYSICFFHKTSSWLWGYLISQTKQGTFSKQNGKVQYRACLAMTGWIQGTSRERLYDEFGLNLLFNRCWRNKLILFV